MFNKVQMKDLVLHLKGSDATPTRLYEHFLAHTKAVIVRPVPIGRTVGAWQESFGPDIVSRVGFKASEALLPYDARSFQGYRLLHEYFAFPQRFSFVRLGDVSRAIKRCDGGLLDVIVALSQENPE